MFIRCVFIECNMYNYYLSIMFMLGILLWVVYLYIIYNSFLFWRIFLGLSWRFQRFHIDPQDGMFRITLKISCFSDSYSSLGETRLCPIECSIVKQRFSAILWHFLEHFQSFSAVLCPHFLSVLAIRQRLKPSFACCYRLYMG